MVGNECYNEGHFFMPLNLYRRHFRTRGKCLGGYPPDFRSYEHDELRRGWKNGTLGRTFKRRNTKQTSWPEAKAVAHAWEAAGRWRDDMVTPAASVQPVADSTAVASQGITIERAVTAFLAEHAESSAPNTQKKYGILMKKLRAHSAEQGSSWSTSGDRSTYANSGSHGR